jgi:hypothetical protein
MERQDSFDLILDGLEFEGFDEIAGALDSFQPPTLVEFSPIISNAIDAYNYMSSLGFGAENPVMKCISGTWGKDEWLSVEEVRDVLGVCDMFPCVANYVCFGAPNVAAKGCGVAAFKDAEGKQQMLRNIAQSGGIEMSFLWKLVALDGDRR